MCSDAKNAEATQCQWHSETESSFVCRALPVAGERFCIFHLPARNKDQERAFESALRTQLSQTVSRTGFNSRTCLLGYRIPGNLTLSVLSPTAFRATGEHGCSVLAHEPVLMNEADIAGNLEVAAYQGAQVGHLLLLGAHIHGGIRLSHLSVKSLCLRHSTVGGAVDLQDSVVAGDIDLRSATLEGDLDLSHSHTGTDLLMAQAAVRGDLILSDARVLGTTDLREATVQGTAYFDRTELRGRSRFDFCRAALLWLGENRPRLVGPARCGIIRPGDWRSGFSFWRFARYAFEDAREADRADRAYYYERVWKWRSGWRRTVGESWLITILRAPFYGLGYIMDLMFLRTATAYGASMYRLFAAWASAILAFSALYYYLGFFCPQRLFDLSSPGWQASHWSYTLALYYSVATFTRLGNLELHPAAGLGSMLIAAEAVLGTLLVTLTILVIGRKFLR